MRSRLVVPVATSLAVLALAGCGSDDTASDAGSGSSSSASASPSASPSSSTSPSAPASTRSVKPAKPLPACDKVWVEGKRLPGNYRGCQKDGKKDRSLIIYCSIGNRLATYGDSYYAVPGSRIFKAHPTRNKDKNWTMVHDTCTG